jgi:hypothetical protein
MPKETQQKQEDSKLTKEQINFSQALSYMKTAKLILRDLEKANKSTAFFQKYSKEDITKWLSSPEQNEKQLRNASIYLYNASSHYRRLINYFAKMAIFAYIVVPYKLDTDNVDIDKFKKSYKKILDKLDTMNIKHEFLKIMTTIFREDVFYGYEYSTKDSYFIKKLPPDYCTISSTEDGVYNFAFDFSYFKTRKDKLEAWGEEFQEKFRIYETNTATYKWQELDSSKTICIKLNEDIEYPIAPFVGLLPMIYDIEDYKMLTKAKEEIGNYKMLSLKIPIDDEGNYKFDYDEAVKFYNMMGAVLPENIGLALTPLEIDEHSFEKAGAVANVNNVANAETNFWSAGGVSELLFNSQKSSSATIGNSIKADEEIVYAVFRQLERWINRKLKLESGIYKFKLQFIDTTIYSRKEFIEQLLKVGQYGMPIINALCSCLGYSPADTSSMAFLENEVLKYHFKLIPLQSSHTQGTNSEGGAPKVDDDQLSDAGVATRENDNRVVE